MFSKILLWWLPSAIVLLGLAGCAEFDARKGPDPIIDGAAVQNTSNNKAIIISALAEDAGYRLGEPVDYYGVAEAGFNYVDDQCRSYFDNLFFLERHREELKSGLAASAATTAAILGVTHAAVPTLTIVAAAFGLTSSATDIVAGTYLYRLPPATTQGFVEKLQLAFRDAAAANRRSINTPASAYYLIQRYLSLCLPPTIEAEITKQISSTTAFGVQTGRGPFFSIETESTPPVSGGGVIGPSPIGGVPGGTRGGVTGGTGGRITGGSSGRVTGGTGGGLHPNEQVKRTPPPPNFILHPIGPFESNIPLSQGIDIQKALCVSPADGDFGDPSSETRIAIAQFKAGFKNIPRDAVNPETGTIKTFNDSTALGAAVHLRKGKGTCQAQGFNDAFDVGVFVHEHPQ